MPLGDLWAVTVYKSVYNHEDRDSFPKSKLVMDSPGCFPIDQNFSSISVHFNTGISRLLVPVFKKNI